MMGEGRSTRCQAAPRRAPCAQAVPEEGAERARASVSYVSSMEPLGRVGVGPRGPRAQRLPLPQAVPRHCPAPPAPSELCPQLGRHLDPPHSDGDPTRQEQTGLSGRTPAGDELLLRIVCHEHGVAFHVPKVGWPRPSPGCLAPGPSFQLCEDRNFILFPSERPPPSPSVQQPRREPPPRPGAKASLFRAQHGAD